MNKSKENIYVALGRLWELKICCFPGERKNVRVFPYI